jgi:hypothetical protein
MNKVEKPIDYIINYVFINKLLDEFTINNAKDELNRLREQIKNEHLA